MSKLLAPCLHRSACGILIMEVKHGRYVPATSVCAAQELQVNEEYVEKETEFDVNEEDVEPQIRCAVCVCRV